RRDGTPCRHGVAQGPWRGAGRSEADVHPARSAGTACWLAAFAAHRRAGAREGDFSAGARDRRGSGFRAGLPGLRTRRLHRLRRGARLPGFGILALLRKEDFPMSDLTKLTIAEARRKLRAKEIKATEITDAYLAAINRANPVINAYIAVTPEKARDMAKASDAKLSKGEGGALEGIPLGIKDLFATEGVHTQACSHVLDGFKPRYESTVTANLWADGAVMLGKLNMDEFAMGSSNETSHYGPVVNPWRARGSNADLVPGGSSGGSAAAVAAHLCLGATATDTGGSIRQPAALTGTVGIKPTYGRCSRWGIVAFASSLDQAGPIARDVRDAAILLKSMASHDPRDTTSVDMAVPDYEAALTGDVRGLKVGIPKEYRIDGMPEEIDR